MPYPDIKDPHAAEELAFLGVFPKVLLVVSAPVWVTVFLVWDQEGFWSAVGLSVLFSVGVACFIAVLLPQSVLTLLQRIAGFRTK